MNLYLKTGSIIVVFALLGYSVFITSLRRRKTLSRMCVIALVAGITLDCCATGLMIAGSGRRYFTIHGFMGYSALGMMIFDGVMIGSIYRIDSGKSNISRFVLNYSMVAYVWWVVVFLTGVVTAMIKH